MYGSSLSGNGLSLKNNVFQSDVVTHQLLTFQMCTSEFLHDVSLLLLCFSPPKKYPVLLLFVFQNGNECETILWKRVNFFFNISFLRMWAPCKVD